MMAKEVLDVRLEQFEEPIGQLISKEDGEAVFGYHTKYLGLGEAIPLSISLPLREEPYADQETRAFFDNLLPENDQLQQTMDREKLSRSDIVGLLKHLGADCSGAVSCLPTGKLAQKIPGNLDSDYNEISADNLNEIVRRLADREPLPNEIQDPSPIAGVQRKIAVTQLAAGRFGIPKPTLRVPTTHIIKVPRRFRQREARLEAASAAIAAETLPNEVVLPDVLEFDDVSALLITRYDRIVREKTVRRIHQEDFAQALGLPASMKYERYGSGDRTFSVAKIASLLDYADAPAREKRNFILTSLFNLAIGNVDNHAKNHAFLYDQDATPSLAPLYDLLPTKLDKNVTDQLAFDVGKAKLFKDITREDIHFFLQQFGIRRAAAQKRFITDNIRPLLLSLDNASARLTAMGVKDFDDLIGSQIRKLMETLGLEISIRERDLYVPQGAGGWGSLS